MPEFCGCRRGFLIGLASFACVGTTGAQTRAPLAVACPEIAPQISVRAVQVAPIVDDSTNSFQLAQIMNQGRAPGSAVSQHGPRPAGLNSVEFDVGTNLQVATVTGPDRRAGCTVPSRIEIVVTTKVHRIYVARDLAPPRSCLRDVVLEHENRHARINFDCLDDARATIHAALLRNLAAAGRVESRNADPAAANAEIMGRFLPIIRENFGAAVGRARARHATMDSNEAYRRDWAKCG